MLKNNTAELAIKIRAMRDELFKAVSGEVCDNLSNIKNRDITYIESKYRDIKDLEELYHSKGGLFSSCYATVNLFFLSKNKGAMAAITSLADSGKIAMEKKQEGAVWLIIPMDNNKDNTMEKIKKILNDDNIIFNGKKIPMQDMILKRSADNDFEI